MAGYRPLLTGAPTRVLVGRRDWWVGVLADRSRSFRNSWATGEGGACLRHVTLVRADAQKAARRSTQLWVHSHADAGHALTCDRRIQPVELSFCRLSVSGRRQVTRFSI